ncbi:uncharacterized protein VTP21DRAFT_8650 [Calcarisporiella thermophila]|uniref:uncharacterized protein n=1 Tax=Calcarisporiella thermophila TaxID=911321 RepID=UPI003742F3DF
MSEQKILTDMKLIEGDYVSTIIPSGLKPGGEGTRVRHGTVKEIRTSFENVEVLVESERGEQFIARPSELKKETVS